MAAIAKKYRVTPAPPLTPRQVRIMQGVHSGLLNKQIAYDLGIAESTVKAHMTQLMRRLQVSNRAQVAQAARAIAASPARLYD
ncbi:MULTISPECIES: helix-turn-helix domain-containing protein [unclassified Sphingomonas]|uniref:helix-turn-helix domain-containing protein n=1 Tax=unclassified Sphingomonas TaxID=196159 RepID=UPI0007000123|nr:MULTISPECIES: LuxR C-terminal-related transcriptional regulator [unclassified Sphingomonas]KQM96551.1 LuxR family transcriptional regulator [Sphingomonas sp. Leaf25]KQN39293.1 LuxR family transcriptional regulator [Sphingomonas sp. Leaf42]KQT28569.1 LuxR family transcriptional regulator [Sphingomonas sp. Leaf407]